MAKNITLAIPDDLYAVIKMHPEINWSNIAKKSIESFVKVVSKSEGAINSIEKEYGAGVKGMLNLTMSENSNENKFPGEEGMLGLGYSYSISFNASVYPRKINANSTAKLPDSKEIFKSITKK
ncbi:MAG: hypothetical protein ACP5MZ_02470 [Candidatus Micrarchaeia archaeon]